MIRVSVTLVIVAAALGHVVNSRPQNSPLDPSRLSRSTNSLTRPSAAFGSVGTILSNINATSDIFSILSSQRQTTAPSPDRKKRNHGSLPFQNLIPSYIPGMFIKTGTGQDSTTNKKPIEN
jgi:hypothetical protein